MDKVPEHKTTLVTKKGGTFVLNSKPEQTQELPKIEKPKESK